MQTMEVWSKRQELRTAKLVTRDLPPLGEGEILAEIDKFALTANNVSYAISGDFIGYWKYFPAEGEWGRVPVWGFADVIESRADGITKGERIWGFFPMATHVVLTPGRVTERQFTDVAEHRRPLPGLYNDYMRTLNDPPAMKAMEDQRCVLFPLFATSYILYDYLLAHDYFGASQVIVGSASSKTGFGLAYLIHHDREHPKRVIGLTSPRNIAFVEGLKVCDQIVAYDAVASLDPMQATAFVDMAGSGEVISALHRHFGENVKESCIVGATHWEADRSRGDLPGAKPAFFFAPAHIAKRNEEWGNGVLLGKAMAASAKIAAAIANDFKVDHIRGPEAVAKTFVALVNNEVPPSRGLMLTMKS